MSGEANIPRLAVATAPTGGSDSNVEEEGAVAAPEPFSFMRGLQAELGVVRRPMRAMAARLVYSVGSP